MPLAPARRRGPRRRPVRRRDRAGHRARHGAASRDVVVDRDEHPRPDTTRSRTLAALRPVRLKLDAGVHRHRRQRQRPERRRRAVRRHHPRGGREARPAPAAGAAVVGGGRRRPRGDGHRPGPRDRRRAGPRRADPRRDRPDRAQRGLRRPGARRACASGRSTRTDDRLNPNGSGISLGHPVGATGAPHPGHRWRTKLHRRDARYVLETMCIGGGQGLAAVFEAVR